MTEPESGRWARWKTALTMLALGIVAVVGLGTTFVVADTGAGAGAASGEVASPSPEPTETTSSPSTADGQTTLGAKPTKTPEPKPTKKPPKEKEPKEKKTGLLDDVQDLLDETVPPAVFRVASFNVLGASHTGRGGNKPGFATSTPRMSGAVGLIRAFGADVVGFQEFESAQNAAFHRMTGGRWGTYPGMQLGRNAVRNSIGWRRDVWQLVSAHTIAIPYFHGHRVPMPYVLLEHIASGRKVWFHNVHNPASTRNHGNNQRWRHVATSLEIGLANRLRTQTPYPVVFTGDLNERAEAFCPVTTRAAMHAANGGSSGGRCLMPGNAGIDWIFGTDDIAFSNYAIRRSRASDHPIIVSTATIAD